MQLIRLPLRNPCTLLRICQIAYNIGQYLKEHEKSPYSIDSIKYFKINNLENLNSYILLDNKLDSKLDNILDMLNQINKKLDMLN